MTRPSTKFVETVRRHVLLPISKQSLTLVVLGDRLPSNFASEQSSRAVDNNKHLYHYAECDRYPAAVK